METNAPWSEDDIRRAGILDNAVFFGRISLCVLLYFAYRFPLNFGFLDDLAKWPRIMIAWALLIAVYNGIHFYAMHFTGCKKFQWLSVFWSRIVPRMLAQNLRAEFPNAVYKWGSPFKMLLIAGPLFLVGITIWLVIQAN